jgi:hypothetical protein
LAAESSKVLLFSLNFRKYATDVPIAVEDFQTYSLEEHLNLPFFFTASGHVRHPTSSKYGKVEMWF